MQEKFTPYATAEAWQMSTPPIMLLAAHYASLTIFNEAGFENLIEKSKQLSSYLLFVLNSINSPVQKFSIITPMEPSQHGCQVSFSVNENAKAVFDQLLPNGIFADWREPNVIRVAPVPLYNTFEEIFLFGQTLKKLLDV